MPWPESTPRSRGRLLSVGKQQTQGLSIWEALAGKRVRRVGGARDVDDTALVLHNEIQSAHLVLAQLPQRHGPLEARHVRVEVKWAVQQVPAQ